MDSEELYALLIGFCIQGIRPYKDGCLGIHYPSNKYVQQLTINSPVRVHGITGKAVVI